MSLKSHFGDKTEVAALLDQFLKKGNNNYFFFGGRDDNHSGSSGVQIRQSSKVTLSL